MNWLTIEERRRIYLAQQRTRETLRRPHSETVGAFAPPSDRGRLRWIAAAVMIAALLGGGLFASPTLEFRALDSLVEALLPTL